MNGEMPTSPVVFAACDSKYYMEHAPALVASCDKVGKDLHIHIVNPLPETEALTKKMQDRVSIKYTVTTEEVNLETLFPHEIRAFYASLRFLVAPTILQSARRMLIVDIDCMVMNDFDFPFKPLGYFPRESLPGTVGWEAEGTKVAAGAVYYDADAYHIADQVKDMLKELPYQWFNDQIALSRVFSQVPEDMVHHFDNQFMDWEFIEGTTIWTGKGPRKYDNPTYVNMKKEFTECLLS